MDLDSHNLKIVLILTFGFAYASIFGYLFYRLHISAILGYILAGYIIGPYSPGFVADLSLAEQLAEVGIVLMMFEIGMHFKTSDLWKVKNVAIPGAIGQSIIATVASALVLSALGWSMQSGVIIGLSIAVASTVVLVRMLKDNHILHSPQGLISVGWLIVEDFLSVAVLLMLPWLAEAFSSTHWSMETFYSSILWLLLKCVVLVLLMFTIGKAAVSFGLLQMARLKVHELFTVGIIALTFVVAVTSSYFFGTSIALGAFIAGMLMGQTESRHQVSANALPMKDTFVVIFFLTVGMLFNPAAIQEHFSLFLAVLGLVLIVKPLAAFLIVYMMRYPLKTAVTIAIALAQIGEFSFIISENALNLHILPDEGYDIIVAVAIVSIGLNPLLFKLLDLWHPSEVPEHHQDIIFDKKEIPEAIVVGFGPLGEMAAKELMKKGYLVTIVDHNIDAGTNITSQGMQVVFGDSQQPHILESANISKAKLLVITMPDTSTAIGTVHIAKGINPNIKIIVKIMTSEDSSGLQPLGVTVVCSEQEEIDAFRQQILNIH